MTEDGPVAHIVVTKRFMTQPLAKQELMAGVACSLAHDVAELDTCSVERNDTELGSVDIMTDGPEVTWESWYLAAVAQRDFSRAP